MSLRDAWPTCEYIDQGAIRRLARATAHAGYMDKRQEWERETDDEDAEGQKLLDEAKEHILYVGDAAIVTDHKGAEPEGWTAMLQGLRGTS